MNVAEQRISEKTLKNFYESLTELICEYLHSFRDERHLRFMISNDVISRDRDLIIKFSKEILDSTAGMIILEQKKKDSE